MNTRQLYRPPAPLPRKPVASLLRMLREGEGNLLSLLPKEAYTEDVTTLGYSRRSIVLINSPDIARDILTDPAEIFPKNDLMTGALAPLVGDSLFSASGDAWRRQRRMIDSAFSQLRIKQAFPLMQEAVRDFEQRLELHAGNGETFSLDMAMSHLTADIISRAIFARPLDTESAKRIFDAFTVFEHSVANVNIWQLLFGRPFADVKQPQNVLDACTEIRQHLGLLVDEQMKLGQQQDTIATAVINARDPETGDGFSREEIIDQIGVFFLAGHETTASVLTWVFYILAMSPQTTAEIREELKKLSDTVDISIEQIRELHFTRSVFRETLRLYPPITFIPRVAVESTTIGGVRIKRGAMLLISPWATHRNNSLWPDADRFDPRRFERGSDQRQEGTFMSFGVGPRVCVGAGFATVESALVMARLIKRFDIQPVDPDAVKPAARLTTRPAREILCRVQRRA